MHCLRKSVPILAIVGVYLLTRGSTLAAAILLAIAGGQLLRWWRDPRRTLHQVIRTDAARHGARVPSDGAAWAALEQVYLKYRKSTERYSSLGDTYADLIDSMWTELRLTTSLSEWRRIVRQVAAEWPTPWSSGESPLTESLRKAQRDARNWRDASREAAGHVPV